MDQALVRGQTGPMMTEFVLVPRLLDLQQWLEGAKQRGVWLGSGKSPYFMLSFSFQFNILFKIKAGLLRNLCGNLDEKFLRDQSSALKEMFRRWMRWSFDKIP